MNWLLFGLFKQWNDFLCVKGFGDKLKIVKFHHVIIYVIILYEIIYLTNVIWLFYYLFIEYLACIHSAEIKDIAMKSKIHYPLEIFNPFKGFIFQRSCIFCHWDGCFINVISFSTHLILLFPPSCKEACVFFSLSTLRTSALIVLTLFNLLASGNQHLSCLPPPHSNYMFIFSTWRFDSHSKVVMFQLASVIFCVSVNDNPILPQTLLHPQPPTFWLIATPSEQLLRPNVLESVILHFSFFLSRSPACAKPAENSIMSTFKMDPAFSSFPVLPFWPSRLPFTWITVPFLTSPANSAFPTLRFILNEAASIPLKSDSCTTVIWVLKYLRRM